MRTVLVMLTLVLCVSVFGICVYVTTGSEEKGSLNREEEDTKRRSQGTPSTGVRGRSSTLPESEPAARPPEFFEEPTGTTEEPPERREAEPMIEKPIILLPEEVEITKDIPRGTSFDQLSKPFSPSPQLPATDP